MHTRGLHILSVILIVCMTGLWYGWDVSFVVQPSFNNEPRGIPAFELVSVLLASIIPSITMTRLDAWERLEVPLARAVNAAVTAVCVLLPIATLPVWVKAVHHRLPNEELPSAWGYVGTILLLAAIGQLLFWSGGSIVALVATPAIWVAAIYLQQLLPNFYPFVDIARGDQWETHWSVTSFAVFVILAISWFGYSLPRRSR